jgi:hypothetical protein
MRETTTTQGESKMSENTTLDYMGADADKVRTMTTDWDKVLRDGIIISIQITQFQGYAKLTTERLANLGAKFESSKDAVNETIRAGSYYLIPKSIDRAIRRVVNRSRVNLDRYSLPVMWGRMVPATAYEAWSEEHKSLEDEFNALVDNLCEDLDTRIAEQTEKFRTIFWDVAAQANMFGWTILPSPRRRDGSLRRPARGPAPAQLTQWVDGCVQDLVNQIPSAEVIRSRYTWSTDYQWAPMSDEIAQSEANAQRIRDEASVDAATMSDERRKMMESMGAEVKATLERKRAEVESTFRAAETDFYSRLRQTAQDITGAIDRNGNLGAKPALALKNMIQTIQTLNVFDDKDINQLAESLDFRLDKRLDTYYNDKQGRDEALVGIGQKLADLEKHTANILGGMTKKRGRRIAVQEELSLDDAPKVEATRARRFNRLAVDVDTPTLDTPAPRRRRRG